MFFTKIPKVDCFGWGGEWVEEDGFEKFYFPKVF